ncbi:MAG: hypothetical protein E7638_02575 [Ruminococcaceae bacterium]|nr:hypothetical protein [Oscillospiraceae bacterium]
MKSNFKVRSHKKTERKFTEAFHMGDLLNNLTAYSDKIIYVWKENGEKKEITYGDFVELVKCFSCGIKALVGVGERVAVMGETSPYWIAAYMGIIASGNTAVPMDKELDPGEVKKFLASVDTKAFVFSAAYNETFRNLADGHESIKYVIPMSADEEYLSSVTGAVSYDSIVKSGLEIVNAGGFEADTDTERCAEMLFTSGTTGTSKCVMLCQRNIFAAVNSACSTVDFSGDDVLLSVLPIHHTYELTCGIAAINYGMKICINDSLRHVMKNIKEYQPTGLVLVPLFVNTMYKKILSEAKRNGKDKVLAIGSKIAHAVSFVGIDMSKTVFADVREAFGGRLNKIICGGAALEPSLIPAFENFGISIYEGYGITECAPLVAVTPYYKRICGSIGPAVPCCEVKIDGLQTDENGNVCGEILVKGDNVMLGYYNNPEANEAVFTDDGWFRTGDYGYLDKNGYIHITGRIKSVIVLDNGKNVFPEEIEEYLERIETIAESVVVGRTEADGTKLVAVIFPNYEKAEGASESEIRTSIQKAITELNKKLPSFKQIHKLEFRKTEFEKTTSRKIKRHLVK